MLDIETTPHTVHTWGLFNQTVGLSQLVEPTRLLCAAAKWVGERKVHFAVGEEWYGKVLDESHTGLLGLWQLLDEADAVITYNGDRFDIPHLNREFVLAGMGMPAPFASIDLLKTMRRQFRFASNKLDHVAQQLGAGGKVKHPGFQLWLDCMAGDEKAWRTMRRYNVGDVRITEKSYLIVRGWIKSHPTVQLFDTTSQPTDSAATATSNCPTCGSTKVQSRGTARTVVSTFQRFQCTKCGRWFRGSKRIDFTNVRGV